MPVSEKKLRYEERMNSLMDQYSKILFCNLDNVRSMQLHRIRGALRGHGELLVGKKTLQKKIIDNRSARDDVSDEDKLLKELLVDKEMLVGNLGMLFTNSEVEVIQKILSDHRVNAPARVGAIAPVDVTIPAGNTGLEPTMTSFFQALNIQTKIARGTVEIMSDRQVLSVGEKVDNSVAVLLQKLNINPFFYEAQIDFFWDHGLIFSAQDLATTPEVIEQAIKNCIPALTAASIASGIVTEISFPHIIREGFKNLLAVSVASEYVFDEFGGAQLRSDVLEGKFVAAPTTEANDGADDAVAEVEEEEEESDDDFGMGSLF